MNTQPLLFKFGRQSKLMALATAAAFFSVLPEPEAMAEIGFATRNTQLGVVWLYGYAGDVRGGGAGDTNIDPKMSDGGGVVNGRFDEGQWMGHNWSATANWIATHGYAVRGSRDDVTAISASGATMLTAFSSGGALSELNTTNNLLQLGFTVGGDAGSITTMVMRALFNESDNQADSTVRVDMLGPFGWTAVGIWDSNGASSVIQSLNLGPGEYRVESVAWAHAVDTNPALSSYQYTLTLAGEEVPDFLPADVPEPTSAALFLATGAFFGGRRLRRS
jgi:hypothetical protein